MKNDKLKANADTKVNADANTQTITASDLWRLIGKQAGASEKQVEDLVRAMKAAQNEKGDKGETDDDIDDDIDDETNEDEGGSKDEGEDENIEEYSEQEYVERLDNMLGTIDCYGRTGTSIEGTLSDIAISINVLTRCLLEKELYQIKNKKGNNND
jgi:hypothetical protein